MLRGIIDHRRRAGQFLILGSVSLELLKQFSESLAGRIAYKELTGLTVSEIKRKDQETLWLRGAFPDSVLAHNQGEQVNVSKLAGGLDVSLHTTTRYIDLLEDLQDAETVRQRSGEVGIPVKLDDL